MKRFADMSEYDREFLADDAIDWAGNGFAKEPFESDASQYIKYLIEEGELHEDDKDEATEWLEEELERR